MGRDQQAQRGRNLNLARGVSITVLNLAEGRRFREGTRGTGGLTRLRVPLSDSSGGPSDQRPDGTSVGR